MIFSSSFSFCLLSSFSLSLLSVNQSYYHKVLINVTNESAVTEKLWPFKRNNLRFLHVLSLLYMEQILAFHCLLQQSAILQHQSLNLVQQMSILLFQISFQLAQQLTDTQMH